MSSAWPKAATEPGRGHVKQFVLALFRHYEASSWISYLNLFPDQKTDGIQAPNRASPAA
jgi:hypothetical protein